MEYEAVGYRPYGAERGTVSPGPMTPLVTPLTAYSPDALIEAVWASTDSESSKQSPIGAAITVSSRITRTSPVKPADREPVRARHRRPGTGYVRPR